MTDDDSGTAYYVQVCMGKSCTACGAKHLYRLLQRECAVAGVAGRVTVVPSSCRNRCDYSPSVNVMPGMVLYNHVDDEGVRRIACEHLAAGRPVREYLYCPPAPAPLPSGKRAFTFDPAAFRPRDDDK